MLQLVKSPTTGFDSHLHDTASIEGARRCTGLCDGEVVFKSFGKAIEGVLVRDEETCKDISRRAPQTTTRRGLIGM